MPRIRDAIRGAAGSALASLYQFGSLVVGDFDVAVSDIDLIGECEVLGEKISGIAVHIGARVAASAAAGEVLVSNTVKDLVAGAGIRFESRGTHVLKGVPGEWQLFVVAGGA